MKQEVSDQLNEFRMTGPDMILKKKKKKQPKTEMSQHNTLAYGSDEEEMYE